MKLKLSLLTLLTILSPLLAYGAEERITSPDGSLALIVSDDGGRLRYRVEVNGKPVMADSRLGLEIRGSVTLGADCRLVDARRSTHDEPWENRFGSRRLVPNRWQEMALTIQQPSSGSPRTFGLIVRAYDNGLAFRYDLPVSSGLGHFVLEKELTEFRFAGDYRSWAGTPSDCAEVQYPEGRLSAIPVVTLGKPGSTPVPYRSTLPLLVEAPDCYVAVAESDLRDWSGMFLTGTGSPGVATVLASRSDKNGLVVSTVPRVSPWRVLMIGHRAADLFGNDLIANLATPSLIGNSDWVRPGACAWDAWWTGVNPTQPKHTGVNSRGDTRSHKEFIDFASEMGWPYQLMDWFWYQNMTSFNKSLHSPPNAARADFTHAVPDIDLPELVGYAKSKNVRLLIWAHSLDIETFGLEKAMTFFADQGFAGVKIDFLNSQSQETVQWVERLLAEAARRHLLIDLHGMYAPTGLARTYPNFITQEGVLGNEYNKLGGNRCTPLHTITLPFTRALLGPMDFTPGGFLNRWPKDFKVASPAQVMGTRSRQLAMTVIYPSPLQVMCDSPSNYRGQPGIEFLRGLPTAWDDTTVVFAEVAKCLCIARRSGDKWYVAAMNGDDALTRDLPLNFIGSGQWTMTSVADGTVPGVSAETVVESEQTVDASTSIKLTLAPAGGYVAVLKPVGSAEK
jgi:alpha-glucosidase